MHKDWELFLFTKLIDFQTAVVVNFKLLNIGVKLYAVKPELFKVTDILLHIGGLGVKSAKTCHTAAAFRD